MLVYGLVGKSGSGKSHHAQYLSRDYCIECIIDDGLLIKGNQVLAGYSAKKENTRAQAVRRAIFTDPEHRQQVKDAIENLKPSSILILGTSNEMIQRIIENLSLPPINKLIRIEDIASQKEIDTAEKVRREQGKHVIPVPTFAVKKDFSGYFIDSIKNFAKKGKDLSVLDIEKTVVRPTFSYLGKYNISNAVIKSMAAFSGENIEGAAKITKVSIKNASNGIMIDMDVSAIYGYNLQSVAKILKEKVKYDIEYMTGINVIEINVYIKNLVFNSRNSTLHKVES